MWTSKEELDASWKYLDVFNKYPADIGLVPIMNVQQAIPRPSFLHKFALRKLIAN